MKKTLDFQLFTPSDHDIEDKVFNRFGGVRTSFSQRADFLHNLIPNLLSKKEVCTLRYAPDLRGKRILLPKVDSNGWIDMTSVKGTKETYYGIMRIPMIVVARVKDMPQWVIEADEYYAGTRAENFVNMREDISNIYKNELNGRPISREDFLCGWFIEEIRPKRDKHYLLTSVIKNIEIPVARNQLNLPAVAKNT